jgi:hypothetical protein
VKNITPKVGVTIALLALLGLNVVGCSSPEPSRSTSNESSNSEEKEQTQEKEAAPEPVNLEGEWKQNNANDPENSWQAATITGDTIEVNWVADGGDTKSLYWAGTVEVPSEGESFSFDSANDTTKTDSAMLASSDPTKTFTFENDELSYEITAMGTTMTVRLSRE